MSKLVLYIYEEGELEDLVEGLPKIKRYIKKYEDSTKGSSKEVPRNSKKT